MSNIEILEEFTKLNIIYPSRLGLTKTQYDLLKEAILNVLAERKQDKDRIKELEAKLEFKKWGDLDNLKFEEYINEFIPKQKIKDYLKEEKERFEVYKKESENNENLKLGMYKHLGAKNMCEKILGIEKIVTLD